MKASEWKKQGTFVSVNGFDHFVYDSNSDKPVLLILHGYPTCIYDFYKAVPLLETHFRVIMHDHLGFGFSDKPLNYSYSLIEQTDQALMLWQLLGIKKAIILAHDYGTSIATEILARLNRFNNVGITVPEMVLCNGSMHVEMAHLRLIQKLLLNPFSGPIVAAMSSRKTLARNLKNIYHDSSLLSCDEINALWEMMSAGNGKRVLHKTTQYIKSRHTYWHRWIGALRTTEMPINIIWAMNDPVAVSDMARVLAEEIKNNSLTELDDMGHYPMLEQPEKWARAVIMSLSK